MKIKSQENASISIMKIICISIILILISGIGVMAVNTQLNDVKIVLRNGYEMTVLTSKTKVSEILEDNNIILEDDEKTVPGVDEEIKPGETIEIKNKSEKEIQIVQISKEGVQTTIDDLLKNYAPITEKIEVEKVEIPYETINKQATGTGSQKRTVVLQKGKNGLKEITYKVKYQNKTQIEKTKLSEKIVKKPVNKIVQVQKVTSRSSTTARTTITATGTKGDAQAYARQKCLSYGWSESDFSCLVKLWNRESGWRVTAYNRYSGAYGIPQALPGSKMASAGPNYKTSYQTQINWGLKYIKSRYGTPTSAWNHSCQKGWY